jgi:hypothetical protein
MASKRLSRALTTGVLATAMACAGGGVATGAAPPDSGASRSTAGYAFTFLGSSDVFMPFDVFTPSGTDPFGVAEIYVQGYECFLQNTVPATVEGLRRRRRRARWRWSAASTSARTTPRPRQTFH